MDEVFVMKSRRLGYQDGSIPIEQSLGMKESMLWPVFNTFRNTRGQKLESFEQ
jgi:hypothetical protein